MQSVLEVQERDFSDSSGIIPDVVEMKSRSGPLFIALVRDKIATLARETCQYKKSGVFFFFVWLGFFSPRSYLLGVC